jgi:hypothetical protein
MLSAALALIDTSTFRGSGKESNRAIALACAAAIMPKLEDPSVYEAVDITTAAEKFCAWLEDADSAGELHRRRFALVIASGQTAKASAVLTVAKHLAPWLDGRR